MLNENKTQLQTNNTDLASLTDRVIAAKEIAANLPDAGSGSTIETCTVDLASAADWELGRLWYSNGNEVVNYFPQNVYDRMSLTVAKNTILYITLTNYVFIADVTILGDAEPISDTTNVNTLLFSINGDCSIDPVIGPM